MKFNEKNMKVTQSDAITKWARPFYWKNSSAGEADPRIRSHRGWLTGAKALKHDHLFLHLPHWKAQGPEISTQGSPVPPHASQNELIAEESIFKLWTPTLTHQNFLLSTSCPPPQKATKKKQNKTFFLPKFCPKTGPQPPGQLASREKLGPKEQSDTLHLSSHSTAGFTQTQQTGNSTRSWAKPVYHED